MEQRRPTKEDLEAARGKTIPDVLGPGMRVLFVGINPGLYSGAVGHHFARPGNRFWKTLHGAGFTDRVYSPFEDRALLELGIGVTNLVARTTATADELREGAEKLERKVRRWPPRVAAFVGVTAYRVAFARPQARIGRQDETIAGSEIWVLPNPSGRTAAYQLPQLVAAFSELRAFLDRPSVTGSGA